MENRFDGIQGREKTGNKLCKHYVHNFIEECER